MLLALRILKRKIFLLKRQRGCVFLLQLMLVLFFYSQQVFWPFGSGFVMKLLKVLKIFDLKTYHFLKFLCELLHPGIFQYLQFSSTFAAKFCKFLLISFFFFKAGYSFFHMTLLFLGHSFFLLFAFVVLKKMLFFVLVFIGSSQIFLARCETKVWI